MSTQTLDWKESFKTWPKWIQLLLNFLASILKAPNFIWNIPGLSKLKGIRLIVITILLGFQEAMAGIDINVIAGVGCKVAESFDKICDPTLITRLYEGIMGWLGVALALEDKSDNKGGTWLSGLFKKKG